jgi:hypothetical protein
VVDRLKDKSNLPKIAAIVAVVLVLVAGGVGVALYMQKQSASTDQAASATTPAAVAPTAAPVPVAQAPKPVAAKKVAKVAKAPAKPKRVAKQAAKPKAASPANPVVVSATSGQTADLTTGPDPFWVPKTAWPGGVAPGSGTGPASAAAAALHRLPPLPDVPVKDIVVDKPPVVTPPPAPSTFTASRRVAGVVLGSGVYAILETSGQDQTVQPGDQIDGGEVVAVEPDGITVRTTDNREVHIPLMASAPTPVASSAPSPSAGTPPWAQ